MTSPAAAPAAAVAGAQAHGAHDAAAVQLANQLAGSPALRQAMGYRKFCTSQLRVLVLDSGYHLQKECAQALRALGHAADVANIKDLDLRQTLAVLLHRLTSVRPDFVLSINHIGYDAQNALGALLAQLQVPQAAWYCDSPFFVLRGAPMPAGAHTTAFVWERTFVAAMAALGAQDVHHLPLGCDLQRLAAPAAQPAVQPIVGFVGDSMQTAIALWDGRLTPSTRALAEGWTQTLLARRQPLHEAALAVAQQASPTDDAGRTGAWDALAAATYRATQTLRESQLAAVRGLPLHIWGDEGWQQRPMLGQLRGPVRYGGELAALYASTAVSINATSLQMPTAVNQRVFDVPAAGGFVISDNQAELGELFELGHEAICYDGPAELEALCRAYLHAPRRRQEISARARQRIAACHTYAHRAAVIVETMRRRWA